MVKGITYIIIGGLLLGASTAARKEKFNPDLSFVFGVFLWPALLAGAIGNAIVEMWMESGKKRK
jgi:hypothetical protein